MKKKELCAVACLIGFAGCSSPASDEIEIVKNYFPVQFSVQLQKEILPFSPATRSMPPNTIPEPTVPEGDNADKELGDLCSCIEYVVFGQDETGKPVKHRTYQITEPDIDFGIVYDTLPAGNYRVCFLAHNSKEAAFAKNVFSFAEVSDAFYHTASFSLGENEESYKDISLERIIGRIEFRASDLVPEEIDRFELSVSNYPGRFDILTGLGVASSAPYRLTHRFTIEEKGKPDTSHSFLSFIPADTTKLSVTLTALDVANDTLRTRTVSDILPLQNKTIRYTGILYTPPQTNAPDNTFQLSIGNNGNWGSTEDVELR